MAPPRTGPGARRSLSTVTTTEDKDAPEKSRLHNRLQNELEEIFREPQEDWSRVRDLLCHSESLQPNYTDSGTQMTTIMRCAYAGETDILNWCFQRDGDADVNAVSGIGRSALHYACNANKVSCIRILLERGANPNLPSFAGETPLHICCMYGKYEAALELLFGTRTNSVIEIDAEDSRRLIPEACTSDKQILRAIKKYRATFEDRRRASLLEHDLKRTLARSKEETAEGTSTASVVGQFKVGTEMTSNKKIKETVVHLNDLKDAIFTDVLKTPDNRRSGDGGKTSVMTPRFKEAIGFRADLRPFRSGAHAVLGIERFRSAKITPRADKRVPQANALTGVAF